MESENYFRPPAIPIELPRKGSDAYLRDVGTYVEEFKTFCRGLHIPDVEKPQCPKCKSSTWQVGHSLTAAVCAHCSIAYCMHCCFEQATTPFWFEDSDLAAVKAHGVECKMNSFYWRRDRDIFLHPEIFEQEMARFIICYMNTVVWSLTRPQVGTFSLILEDETWLEAVREGLLISMPHQPHSALPSMTSMFTSYLAATLKVMSEAPWGGCILAVALMPVKIIFQLRLRYLVLGAAYLYTRDEKSYGHELNSPYTRWPYAYSPLILGLYSGRSRVILL